MIMEITSLSTLPPLDVIALIRRDDVVLSAPSFVSETVVFAVPPVAVVEPVI